MQLLDAEHSCFTVGAPEAGDIDVHLFDLDRVDRVEASDLLDGEQARSERFHKPEDGRHFLARRVLLRQLLAQRTGRAPHELGATPDAHGRPVIEGIEPLRFNSSRTRNWFAVAIHAGERGTPGIDIECSRELPDSGALSRRVFSPEERASLGEGVDPGSDRLFRVWTRKEAVLKAVGRGLSIDPSLITVTLADDLQGDRVDVPDPASGDSWRVCLWDVVDDRAPRGLFLAAALAAPA